MKPLEIRKVNGEKLLAGVRVADDFSSRLFGMMFWQRGRDLPALWFPHCNSIHMFFMAIPLDLVFLDSKLQVVKIAPKVRPWTPFVGSVKAESVLEVVPDAWRVSSIQVGDELVFQKTE